MLLVVSENWHGENIITQVNSCIPNARAVSFRPSKNTISEVVVGIKT